jgi:hypothetical protein
MSVRIAVLLACALIAAATANAHHGFGNFAMNEDIELTGVITRLDFVNPHSWLHFNVTDENGETVEHRCELRSATTLRRSGWAPGMFTPGMGITIQGSPDRADPLACYTSTLVFADGTMLDRYAQRIPATPTATGRRSARLANGEPNLSDEWAVEQRVMTDPKGRDGTLVPLSEIDEFEPGGVPEGQREIPGARGTPEAEEARNPLANPGGRGVVGLTAAGQDAMEALAEVPRAERSCSVGSIASDWGGESVNRITQRVDTILLQYGRHGLERTVHMDMGAHPADVEPSWAGHSIGRWEDDVLVVDTVGFLPGRLTGTTPHSARLHVVERFSLGADATTLTREYTAEDPEYFTESYSGRETLMVANVRYDPEPCVDLTPGVPAP